MCAPQLFDPSPGSIFGSFGRWEFHERRNEFSKRKGGKIIPRFVLVGVDLGDGGCQFLRAACVVTDTIARNADASLASGNGRAHWNRDFKQRTEHDCKFEDQMRGGIVEKDAACNV